MINGQVDKSFGVNLVTFDDLECCRSCGHFYMYHIYQISDGTPESIFSVDGRCDPQTDHGCCCEEFIPENNLSYLEYLYDKKQK